MLAGATISDEARAAAERLMAAAERGDGEAQWRQATSGAPKPLDARAEARGRARAARRGDRRARPALSPGRRADHLGRRIRRAAAAQRGDRGALSGARAAGFALDAGRREAGRALREGAPRRADAVARQRLFRRGRASSSWRRVRRFLGLPAEQDAGAHRRAEDRRALGLAALRAGRAGARRDARRRRGGRGCHRQHPHHRRDPASGCRRACPTSWRCAARST